MKRMENGFKLNKFLKGMALVFFAMAFLLLTFGLLKMKPAKVLQNSKTLASVSSGVPISPDDYEIVDINLYKALLDEYHNKHPEDIHNTTITTTMFEDFTELNISNRNIETLSGLELLHLDNLVSFNASGNKLTEIREDYFRYAKNLKNINLYNNKINAVNFKGVSSSGEKLENMNINLSHNLLKEIDVKYVNSGVVNLSYNLINNVNSVLISDVEDSTLLVELYGNNITSINKDFNFVKVNLGLQGTGNYNAVQNKFDAKKEIKVFKINESNVKFQIFEKNNLEEPFKEILNSEIEDQFVAFNLPINSYVFKYVNELTNEPLYNAADESTYKFLNREIHIIPVAPKITFIINGKEYDTCVKFSGTAKIKFTTEDEGAEVMYSVNGGEWQTGFEGEIRSGGNYLIAFRSVVNGIYSNDVIAGVVSSVSPIMSDGLLLSLIVVGVLIVGSLTVWGLKVFYRK